MFLPPFILIVSKSCYSQLSKHTHTNVAFTERFHKVSSGVKDSGAKENIEYVYPRMRSQNETHAFQPIQPTQNRSKKYSKRHITQTYSIWFTRVWLNPGEPLPNSFTKSRFFPMVLVMGMRWICGTVGRLQMRPVGASNANCLARRRFCVEGKKVWREHEFSSISEKEGF